MKVYFRLEALRHNDRDRLRSGVSFDHVFGSGAKKPVGPIKRDADKSAMG